MNVAGKVIAITGAARGIGAALARRFAEEGATGIAIGDLDVPEAQAVAEQVNGLGLEVDVSNEESVEGFLDACENRWGRIDLCCSNAGIAVLGGLEAPNTVWQRVWEVNFLGHLNVARHVVPRFLEWGGGYLLQTASAAGLVSHFSSGPYAISKNSAVAFAEWLAINYGDQGIGVSCLCPQGVATDMLQGEDPLSGYLREHSVTPEAVADAVVQGLQDEAFLILPHAEVADYFQRKATDYDRWLKGMQRFRRSVNDSESKT